MGKKTLEQHTKTQVEFSRKRRIGMNLLKMEPNQTVFAEIKKFGTYTSEKYPEGIEYFDIVNLKTGEEQRMWVDGGLHGALNEIGGPEKAVGLRLEITRGDQKPLEIINEDGKTEKVKVNTYEVFELT